MINYVLQMIECVQLLVNYCVACKRSKEQYKQVHVLEQSKVMDTNSNIGSVTNSFSDAGNSTMKKIIKFTGMEYKTLYPVLKRDILST